MDLNTGKRYETKMAALADGVAESDIAHVTVDQRLRNGRPIVKFSKGSFKSLARNEAGALVPVRFRHHGER